MSDTTFTNNVTLTDADWFNDVNRLHYTIFGDPATARAALDALYVKGADVVCAATIDLTSTTGDFIHITGSTGPVTAITLNSGDRRFVVFDSTPTLTYNATTLILPGAQNIVVAAGDYALFTGDGSGNTRCLYYYRADGSALFTASGSRGKTPINLGFAATVGSSALTITLTQSDGATAPTASSPVLIPFRNATVATGDVTWLSVTATSTVVISSGSTLGTRNSTPFRVWVVAFNDGGTFRLGVINCLTTVAGAGAGSDVTSIYPLNGWGIASSTAEGGAGGADSASTFYTGTAVTNKAFTVLGYVTYESGLATAGTYVSTPTRAQLWETSMPLPGRTVQIQRNDTGTNATGTTTIPNDNTIPQITEGDEYMTQAITPTSAANVLEIVSSGQFTNDAAGLTAFAAALFQDATANALKTGRITPFAANGQWPTGVNALLLAGGTSATTFRLRAGDGSAGTTSFNPALYALTLNSYMQVTEIMG